MRQLKKCRPDRRTKQVSGRAEASASRMGVRLLTALMLAYAAPGIDRALASETGPGLIADLQIDGNYALLAVSGPVVNRPACVVWGRYVVDVSTPQGQSMLAYLLSAQATGKQVQVYGAGTCSIFDDHETAKSVRDAS
jgi:hypothetical protein